jgi:hypothetical protein
LLFFLSYIFLWTLSCISALADFFCHLFVLRSFMYW